ncbi:MAG TPA: metallophosphoesterase [Candidatus Eisenbacteria bacterium]
MPAALALLCIAFFASARAADEIHWTFTGPTSVTFDWRGTDSTIHYGRTRDYDLRATGTAPDPLPFSSPGPFWEARLTGLEPGALYHYSIEGGPDRTFHTSPRPGENFVVYVESDVGDAASYPRVAAVQSLIGEGAPSFVLVVGDLTYGDERGQQAVDRHFNDVMAWSEGAAYMPAWGNHEWSDSTDDFRNYKGRFDLPHPQASPNAPPLGCCGEDWYWFDCGATRFIAYPEPYRGAWADWSRQARALMDEAEADPAIRFIVTFGHRPAWSSGYHPGDAGLRGLLGALGATHAKYVLNLNGHSHDYERSLSQDGVTHVTAGIGGSPLEQMAGPCPWPGGCPPPAWCAFRAYHHGALRLRFGQASILGEAICGPPGDGGPNLNDVVCTPGEVFDSFTIGEDLAPVVDAPEAVTVLGASPVRVVVRASDPDGDAIRSLSADLSALPAGSGATFTAEPGDTTGTLTWTPSRYDNRTYVVTFSAANRIQGSAATAVRVVQPKLVLEPIRPYPSPELRAIAYSLASWAPANLEVLDVAGRLWLRRDLGAPGPGRHEEVLPALPGAPPGPYWLVISQAGHRVSRRFVLLR